MNMFVLGNRGIGSSEHLIFRYFSTADWKLPLPAVFVYDETFGSKKNIRMCPPSAKTIASIVIGWLVTEQG